MAAFAAFQSTEYERSMLKLVTTGWPCRVIYAGEGKYVCSRYCKSLTRACCGEHPEHEYHSIAPWSIMMAKVKPG